MCQGLGKLSKEIRSTKETSEWEMIELPAVVSSAVIAFVSEVLSNGEVIFEDAVVSGEVISSGEVDISAVLVGSPVLVMLVRCGGLDVPAKEVISAMAVDMGMVMESRAGQLTGEESMKLCSVILGVSLQCNQVWEESPGTLKRTVSDSGQGYLLCSPLLRCPISLWCSCQVCTAVVGQRMSLKGMSLLGRLAMCWLSPLGLSLAL